MCLEPANGVVTGHAVCTSRHDHFVAAVGPLKALPPLPSDTRNIWLLYQTRSQCEEAWSGAPSPLKIDVQCEQERNPSFYKPLRFWSCFLTQPHLAHSDG